MLSVIAVSITIAVVETASGPRDAELYSARHDARRDRPAADGSRNEARRHGARHDASDDAVRHDARWHDGIRHDGGIGQDA
jgi:hypothetical protein